MFTSNNQLHTEQSSNCTMHVVTKELLAGISLLSADYQQLLAGIGIGLTATISLRRFTCYYRLILITDTVIGASLINIVFEHKVMVSL